MDESTEHYYEQYMRLTRPEPYCAEDFAEYLRDFGAEVNIIVADNGDQSLQITYPVGSGFFD